LITQLNFPENIGFCLIPAIDRNFMLFLTAVGNSELQYAVRLLFYIYNDEDKRK